MRACQRDCLTLYLRCFCRRPAFCSAGAAIYFRPKDKKLQVIVFRISIEYYYSDAFLCDLPLMTDPSTA